MWKDILRHLEALHAGACMSYFSPTVILQDLLVALVHAVDRGPDNPKLVWCADQKSEGRPCSHRHTSTLAACHSMFGGCQVCLVGVNVSILHHAQFEECTAKLVLYTKSKPHSDAYTCMHACTKHTSTSTEISQCALLQQT